MSSASYTIHCGDALTVLRTLPDESVQTCVTSPPYWGLRDYGIAGQIGLETSPTEYLDRMVAVFAEVRRVLKSDGTCWVNMGDTYNGSGTSGGDLDNGTFVFRGKIDSGKVSFPGLKKKDLCGMPWCLAFALQASGWWLRADIIWHKTNCLPESVSDRPTKSHEYIFLLSKSQKYFYDAEAILEPCSPNTNMRVSQNVARQVGSERANGGRKTNGNMKAVVRGANPKAKLNAFGSRQNESFSSTICLPVHQRNKRSVWTVPAAGYKGAHFATFPPDLIKPCILAGCPIGGTVLDPFAGSGTTGQVALEYARKFIGIELNSDYLQLIAERLNAITPGLPI